MKNIPGLALMMAVMVSAVQLHCNGTEKVLLKQIIAKVDKLLTEPKIKEPNPKITDISSKSQTCVKGFFCKAEKALREYENLSPVNVSALIRPLSQLTEAKDVTDCPLNRTLTCSIILFLKDVKMCSGKALNNCKRRSPL